MQSLIQIGLFFCSLVICALAQPDLSTWASVVASSFGYALFWRQLLSIQSKNKRFFLAVVWFAVISACHLNWFFSDRYVGGYIYPFLAVLFCGLGVQFGLVCQLIASPHKMTVKRILVISGSWTLLEWSRLFVLSGFSWDPIGLALSATAYGIQVASLLGVYGMSFWVVFTNCLALRFFQQPSWRFVLSWGLASLLPYFFGFFHLGFHARAMEKDQRPYLSALLIQPALAPEEKIAINGSKPLSLAAQWGHITSLIADNLVAETEIVVLPEGAFPRPCDQPYFFADGMEKVSNRILAQRLTDWQGCDLILGLEQVAQLDGGAYAFNAALMLRPFNADVESYAKRILVPMGEYIPFDWCRSILSKYGIIGSFTPGKQAKVFHCAHGRYGVSICYEETYGHLMRENRKQGADVLVNLTNDGWYPRSRLAAVHFMHGRLRTIELGLPLLRACNTGVTCGVDALGRTVSSLAYETRRASCPAAALSVQLPRYNYLTLYSLVGDWFIIGLSLLSVLGFVISKKAILFKIFK